MAVSDHATASESSEINCFSRSSSIMSLSLSERRLEAFGALQLELFKEKALWSRSDGAFPKMAKSQSSTQSLEIAGWRPGSVTLL
jgi:hypothetical protein